MADVYGAVGRRKTSIARVRMKTGPGAITVNDKPMTEYFSRETLKGIVRQPFEVTSTTGKYDVIASVAGGGESGQAGAVRHGIARTLCMADATFRGVLKKAGLLTRDPRMKERKKYGQKGARKRFQFSKR